MKSTKIIALVLVVIMSCMVLASCNLFKKPDPEATKAEYTYKGYSTALGTNWNPHTWETNADSGILSYLTMPFCSMEALDTEKGYYQWVFEMAESITDVTASHQADLKKYGVTLPEGAESVSDVTSGFVFEFKLNKDAKWENGDPITSEDYIESMKRLLSSKYRNYRANLYVSGESAVAGGAAYFNSEAPIYEGVFDWDTGEVAQAETYYFALNVGWSGNSSYSFKWMYDNGYIYDDYQVEVDADGNPVKDANGDPVYVLDQDGNKIQTAFGATYYEALTELVNPYGYIELNEETTPMVEEMAVQFLAAFGIPAEAAPGYFGSFYYQITGIGEKVEYDAVGCYAVDEYTFIYVCQNQIDFNYFLTSCTDTWLVYTPLYDELTKKDGTLYVTTYGTSKDTTMSYGIYKMQTYEDQKQIVYVQNENWYGWTTDEDGNLVSYTDCVNALDMETGTYSPFKVDGKVQQQYITTKIVVDVMDEEVAKQKFLKGELSEWSPSSEELSQYATSDRLVAVDETYTMSFFFNCDELTLKNLDKVGNNKNSVVLSNANFRKAFSLAVDRSDFVTVTQGWTPAYSLMNHLYHYDFFNDPTSSYRASEPAMKAIVSLYGVKYGEGELYKTLEEAYASITGYNLTEAKKLMKQAHDELVAAGLYTSGEDITIQIGWAKGALQADDNAQVDKMNQYINAAVAGSGFGKITFEAVGNINDRYADTANGLYAIGYGAWGGAALYPFRNFQVYFDPDEYDINEAGCWDPATEELTLTVDGKEVTMTWQDWSNCMISGGKFANVDNSVKLEITAALEQKFLERYYRIPLAVTTSCSILSYQMDYYTDTYNLAYGFGGMRLMSYSYTDAEWADYVASQGGTLNYK